MYCFKRITSVLLLLLIVCSMGYFGKVSNESAVSAGVMTEDIKTIILDAGHAALENTID